MTSATITRRMPRREPPTLKCQRVGGSPAQVTLVYIMGAAVVVVALLFCVWSRVQVVKEGYALSEQARQIKDLNAAQEELKAQAAGLRSPERIEAIARNQLGMQLPTPEQIKTIEYQTRPGSLAANDRPGEGGM